MKPACYCLYCGVDLTFSRRGAILWHGIRPGFTVWRAGVTRRKYLPICITNCFRILTARRKCMPWGAMGRLRRPHQAFAFPAAPHFDGRRTGAKVFSAACCYVRETLCRMLVARMHGGFLVFLVMDRMAHSLLSPCELRRTFFTEANGLKQSNYAAEIPVKFWDNEHNSGGRCAQAAELRRSRREHRTSSVDCGGPSFAQVWSAIHVVRPG
uniref:Uncharacterized protein n=1 Tax=Ralstonia solanacearum TaxID=305 RepID=A0A0S4TYF0_RALSL|nr:protein of unknown function [Ralstonia solanacearum]